MIISVVPDLMLPLAELLPKTLGPYIGLMMLGFVFAVLGHMSKARWLVAIGVMMIFFATLIFPLARIATEDDPPRPDNPIQRSIP